MLLAHTSTLASIPDVSGATAGGTAEAACFTVPIVDDDALLSSFEGDCIISGSLICDGGAAISGMRGAELESMSY
jgi:hypothetical protein